MNSDRSLVAVVSPRGAARAQGGHPWIFRGDVVSGPPPGSDVVAVLDQRRRLLGSAFWIDPPAPIALRVYLRSREHVPFSEELLVQRIERAFARREAVAKTGSAYRLVNGEADLLPGLFVDRYGEAFTISTATVAMDRREDQVAALLARQYQARLVVERNDGSLRDQEALPRRKGILRGDAAGSTLVRAREGTTLLELDLLEDAKTGGFLDQRENHQRAAELGKGLALDAFAYHGGFALALATRASQVTAIDQNPQAVARARRNAELSGLANLEFRVGDSFAELQEMERQGREFDVVVIDPPALAKRRSDLRAALRDYQELNLRALRLTRRDGLLVTCSCSGRVTADAFGEMLVKASQAARREVAVLERRGAASDHPSLLGVPETDYLKCWFVRVM
ncbi:MAG: class I SAM-dependent rRNA methyltransferase [Pseudomonadota bacterium]